MQKVIPLSVCILIVLVGCSSTLQFNLFYACPECEFVHPGNPCIRCGTETDVCPHCDRILYKNRCRSCSYAKPSELIGPPVIPVPQALPTRDHNDVGVPAERDESDQPPWG